MANVDVERLAREKVSEALKLSSDHAACAAEAARSVALETLRANAISPGSADPGESVRLACQGAFSALVLLDKELSGAAIAIISRVADASNELHLETPIMMTWAMEGIARASLALPPAAVSGIQEAIDQTFMGAGEVFREARRRATPAA